MIIHWTQEEEEILWQLYEEGATYDTMSATLGRSWEAVKTRVRRLKAQRGLTRETSRGWSQEEIDLLKDPLLDFDDLERLLPTKTRKAITAKAENSELRKDR